MEPEPKNKRVAYYFDEEIGLYTFNKGHPMRPFRMKITDELLNAYGVKNHMNCVDSTFYDLPDSELLNFHSDEYIDLLKNINESNYSQYETHFSRFGFNADCPCPANSKFYDFCKLYATGSILGAQMINENIVDYAINWSGGLHHAKRSEASGFCYVNDCVLAILELLKVHERVCYLDIDVHHGDGVEEAFFTSDRVLTCSFHKFGDFFPGTGSFTDVGYEKGIYRAVNFPMNEGMDDISFFSIFKPVVDRIMEVFNPKAIFMQCGSDSLSGDKLGCFNLSIRGHGRCVEYVKSLGIPVICGGGGGYTLRNVPRCWTYESSIIAGVELDNEIPENEYIGYFLPEKRLHLPISNMENMNSEDDLHRTLSIVDENIKRIRAFSSGGQIEGHQADQGTNREISKIRQENEEEKSEPHRSSKNVF